jgi:hypothetical protein
MKICGCTLPEINPDACKNCYNASDKTFEMINKKIAGYSDYISLSPKTAIESLVIAGICNPDVSLTGPYAENK